MLDDELPPALTPLDLAPPLAALPATVDLLCWNLAAGAARLT